jgi:hypothetical protein
VTRTRGLGALLGLAIAAVPAAAAGTTAPTAKVATSSALPAGPTGNLTADVESFVVRVEYDLPAPASTGSVPHVNGEVRRSSGSDNAHGVAGAPSQLDPVVGGEYVNPDNLAPKPQRRLPQSECAYPGDLQTTSFLFPTQNQPETANLPATSVATSQCTAGPQVLLHATDAGIGTPLTPSAQLAPVVRSGLATADATAGPDHNSLLADTSAQVTNLSLLNGLVTIGGVSVASHSDVDGHPGGAHTQSRIALSDVVVAGVHFSVDNDQVNVGGQLLALASPAVQQLVDQIDALLSPSGCRLDLLTQPSAYPQGFLLSRSAPELGVAVDGHLAASMRGGLLLLCNLPQSITSKLNGFSPERAQILVGFAFSSAEAGGNIGGLGGFGLGDLGGGAGGKATPTLGTPIATTPGRIVALSPPALPASSAGPTNPPPPVASRPATPAQVASPVTRLAGTGLDPAFRFALFAMCLLVWLALTQLGLTRLRRAHQ